jgi:hypothetical protein
MIAAPIYAVFRKNEFKWEEEQRQVMVTLKKVFILPPTLVVIDCLENAGKIILAVDSSLKNWGAVFIQMVEKRRAPSMYESGMWNDVK